MLLAMPAAIGCFHFGVRTRFWFPRYVHSLGGVGVVPGLTCLASMPPDVPIHQGGWGWLTQALVVLVFPTLVYGCFVYYGGQRAAYACTHQFHVRLCPYGRGAHVSPGRRCPHCGQTRA
jgi:hypothetical protein